jgi:hypothetical protein
MGTPTPPNANATTALSRHLQELAEENSRKVAANLNLGRPPALPPFHAHPAGVFPPLPSPAPPIPTPPSSPASSPPEGPSSPPEPAGEFAASWGLTPPSSPPKAPSSPPKSLDDFSAAWAAAGGWEGEGLGPSTPDRRPGGER